MMPNEADDTLVHAASAYLVQAFCRRTDVVDIILLIYPARPHQSNRNTIDASSEG